jgi:serine/threonine protein kinase
MLYQMVSGQMPLKPTTESFPGWYQAHHKHRPIPLEDWGLKFPLPAGLSDLILGCLAKDPAARPQSVANVLAELEHIQARAQGIPKRISRDRCPSISADLPLEVLPLAHFLETPLLLRRPWPHQVLCGSGP